LGFEHPTATVEEVDDTSGDPDKFKSEDSPRVQSEAENESMNGKRRYPAGHRSERKTKIGQSPVANYSLCDVWDISACTSKTVFVNIPLGATESVI